MIILPILHKKKWLKALTNQPKGDIISLMTLEELQQQVDRDFKLDDTELDAESIKIPLLHNKYLQHFNKFSLLLKKAEYDYKTLQRHKWEYYTGKSDPSVYAEKPFDLKILKADVHIYMDSDDELQKSRPKSCISKTSRYIS